MQKSAISFNVPPKLWEAFRKQTDDLFLSRGPLLDHMVWYELQYLSKDLHGLRQSLRAKRHVAGAMKRKGPVSVNIEVSPETAEALREATHRHNMVRDAFMSRLIIFLRSTDAFLKSIGVPLVAKSSDPSTLLEEMPCSPLRAMEAVRDDPFFYFRSHVAHGHGCGIYRLALPSRFDFAACYMEDERIPGTAAFRRQQKMEADFDRLLSDDTPAQSTKKNKGGAK